MRSENKIKLFGMQNILLESDLLGLEKKGIDIEHAQAVKKENIIDIEVFEIDIRNQAKQMMEAYYLLFCLENSVRKSVSSRLKEKYGVTWWENKVPDNVKKKVSRRQKDEKNTPFSERSNEPIYYSDFLDLIDIIEENWLDFSDTFRSVESIKSTLGTLNILRRGIAHNAVLEEDEIQRFKLHIKDWIRIQM